MAKSGNSCIAGHMHGAALGPALALWNDWTVRSVRNVHDDDSVPKYASVKYEYWRLHGDAEAVCQSERIAKSKSCSRSALKTALRRFATTELTAATEQAGCKTTRVL
jgi:hypothetical protein